MDNLTTMFTDVNDKVGTIAGEVGRTPSSWNSGVFSMIENLSENVMIPIAGMIISAILCYELITMVMDKNNMHEVGSEFFFRYLIKACIAVLLLSYTFDITMAIFDVGNHIVTRAGGIVSGSTTIDVTDTLKTMFDSQIDTMGIGELIGLGIETMIVSLCMKIISLLITVMLFGRMIEIYLYISVAPVPFATFSNREWGGIGNNYIKGLCSLAFQGFFHYGMRGNLCGAGIRHCGCGQSAHSTVVGGSLYRCSVFQPVQDRFPCEINLECSLEHISKKGGNSRGLQYQLRL